MAPEVLDELPRIPQREFQAAELSDGTLRFLGLDPDLMEPLAKMVLNAAQRTQVWLVTHSERLAEAIGESGDGEVRTVLKRNGATTIEGLTLFGTFREEEEDE